MPDQRLGAVRVQWHDDRIEISNPGGFPEGVRLDNLPVTQLRPRNPLPADAFKRAGVVERIASGIDTIFFEQFRNGRPAPNYARSNETRRVAACPATEQRRGPGMRVARKITACGYAITARSNICPVGVVEAQEVHCPSHATPWLFLLKHGPTGRQASARVRRNRRQATPSSSSSVDRWAGPVGTGDTSEHAEHTRRLEVQQRSRAPL